VDVLLIPPNPSNYLIEASHNTTDDRQAWVIAQADGVNIQIDIDMDGDEVVDLTVMTTWSELQDLL
jgi:hypothetical protein